MYEYKVFLNVRPAELQSVLDEWSAAGWRLWGFTGMDHLLILEREK
jgi:hypothetical protein